jgi:Flp pilus assembly protein TadG
LGGAELLEFEMLKKFLHNKEGQFAVITALCALPIFGAVAMSVDFSNLSRLRHDLKDSCDAANVDVAKAYVRGHKDNQPTVPITKADLEAKARIFYNANFDQNYINASVLTLTLPDDVGNTSKELVLKCQFTYNTMFGPVLAGLTHSDVSNYSYVVAVSTMRMRSVAEIALVLDNSGSMSDIVSTGGTRLALLKSASKQLVSTLIDLGQKVTNVTDPIKFSIVPFAGAVNIGNTNAIKTASWMDTRGISPLHHENLNWGTPGASNPTGWRTTAADGAKLDASGNPLTRFSILNNLQFRTGGIESTLATDCMVWKYGQGKTTSSSLSNCAVVKRLPSGANVVTSIGVASDAAVTAINNATYSKGNLQKTYEWSGCVEARPYPYNLNDDTPSTSNPSTLYVPYFAPDQLNTSQYGPSTDPNTASNFNNWWPDTEIFTSAAPYSSAAYNGTDANQLLYGDRNPSSASWIAATARPREVDVAKYFVNKPYLQGFTASSATSTSTRKGQWLYYLDSTKVANPYFGPNFGCTTTPITPLTSDKAAINTKIDAMVASGSTNVVEGLGWGWRTISSKAPFSEGVAETRKDIDKVVIVITDGKNTYYTPSDLGITDYSGDKAIYGSYGLPGYAGQSGPGAVSGMRGTGTVSGASNKAEIFQGTSVSATGFDFNSYSTAMISQMDILCTNIKNADGKILLMTVGLDLDPRPAPTGDGAMVTALKNCSGESRTRRESNGTPSKLFWNATSATLTTAMKEIGDELSNLRFTN